MKIKGLVIGTIVLICAVAGLQWHYTRGPVVDSLPSVAARLNRTLPKPYVNGLVFERAHADDSRLVIDVHIPDIKLEQLDPSKIPIIREQETRDMVASVCADPTLRPLLRKATVGRRFLDQDHKPIFEIIVTETDCRPREIQ